MAVLKNSASLIALMAVVLTVVSLTEVSFAADAPTPAPVAAAGAISPSLALGCLVTFVAFVFGSALKI